MKQLLIIIFWSVCATVTAAQTDIHVARYMDDKVAAVSYTFDDGLQQQYTLLFPQLKKRNIKASFCVIGSKVGRDMKGNPCVTWQQLREMAHDGQEITSHGWAHRGVGGLSAEELRYEVQHNDTVIYNKVGVFPRTYFYPGNRKTDAATAFCSKDRVGTRTYQLSIGSKRDTLWLRHWIEDLMEEGGWGVGMTHGITRGYDAFKDPRVLWSHLDYVCTLRDKLWIATFHDVAAYCKERDNITLKIENHDKETTVTPTMKLDSKIFNHPLTLVVMADTPITAKQDGKLLDVKIKGDKAIMDFNPNGGKVIIASEYGK